MKPTHPCWTCPGCTFLYGTTVTPSGRLADIYYCSRNGEHVSIPDDPAPGGRIRLILDDRRGRSRLDPFFGASLRQLRRMMPEENGWYALYHDALRYARARGLVCKRVCDEVLR
jgi:hypothetical protein